MSKKMSAIFMSLIMLVSLISTSLMTSVNAVANGFGGYNWTKTEGYQTATTSVSNSSEELVVSFNINPSDEHDSVAGFSNDGSPEEDWTEYESVSFSIENPNDFDIAYSFALCTGSDWNWWESLETIIPAGETKDVVYNPQEDEWKSADTDWVNNSPIADLLYVQRINMIVATTGNTMQAGSVKLTNWNVVKSTNGDEDDEPLTPVKGFYVDGSTLKDANDNPFVMRGVNYAFTWYKGTETVALPKIAEYGANTVRIVLSNGEQWNKDSVSTVKNLIKICEENEMIAVLEVHDATGYNTHESLMKAAEYFVEIKDAYIGKEDKVIINIANEWRGDQNSDEWAKSYKQAVNLLRDAGLTHNIMVDAAGWGQYGKAIHDKGLEVLNSDPLENIIFAIHMYGTAGGNEGVIKQNIDGVLNQDLALCIGEFGWNHSDGDVDEETIMSYCEETNTGWLAWSWHGNGSEVSYLDMVTDYTGNTLTEWGDTVVNSVYGMLNTSKVSSVFEDVKDPETTTLETTGTEATEDTETTITEDTSATTTPSEAPISTDDTTTTDGGDATDITTSSSEETTITTTDEGDITDITTISSEGTTVTTTDEEDNKDEIDWDKALYGDINLDGMVRITDVIEFNKYLVGAVELSATAKENANCVYDDRLDMADNMQIAKFLVKQIAQEDLGPQE